MVAVSIHQKQEKWEGSNSVQQHQVFKILAHRDQHLYKYISMLPRALPLSGIACSPLLEN